MYFARRDSVYQSIDKWLTNSRHAAHLNKMSLKPVIRGIKMCPGCNVVPGYWHDFNICHGKELQIETGTLRERVKAKLTRPIAEKDIDRVLRSVFTSVNWLDNYSLPAVGTVTANKQDFHMWSADKPLLRPPYADKKNHFWSALWAEGIISPYFFKKYAHNVLLYGEHYRAIMNNLFQPESEYVSVDLV